MTNGAESGINMDKEGELELKNKGLLDAQGNPIGGLGEQQKVELLDGQGNSIESSDQTPDQNPEDHKGAEKKENNVLLDQLSPEDRQNLLKKYKDKIGNIAFVDVGRVADAEARDVAEEQITEEREKTKGFRNIFKRIWTHNWGREYRHQRKISEVKKDIYSKGDIFAGEGSEDKNHHNAAMGAITDRFLADYEGVVRKESGERKKNLQELLKSDADKEKFSKVNEDINKIVREYATGELSDAAFEEARTTILSSVTGLGKEVVGEGKMYADNLKQAAEQLKQAMDHGLSIEELDLNFNINVGSAVSGIRTESSRSYVDKLIEKTNKSLAGTVLANETFVASAIALATTFFAKKAQGLGQVAGLVGGGIVAGGFSAAKENYRLKKERAQHQRQMAKGKEIQKDSPRRDRMDEFRYETKGANELTTSLLSSVYADGNPESGLGIQSQQDFDKAMGTLTEIETRINLSIKEKIDLIGFSNVRAVEIERSKLEIEVARAKAKLKGDDMKQFLGDKTFDEVLGKSVGAQEKSLLDGDIKEKNRLFKSMKAKAVAGAAVKGLLSGIVVGGLVQEGLAFASDKTQGIFERDNQATARATPFQGLREWINGRGIAHIAPVPPIGETKFDIGGENFRFPEGTSVVSNPDGTVTISHGDKVLAENIKFEFNQDGSLTPGTIDALKEVHIVSAGEHTIKVPISGGSQGGTISSEDYISKSDSDITIKRDLWYDNDTATPFDKNELRTDWGGEVRQYVNENGKLVSEASGVDENGNYVFNISRMSSDGSYHDQFSANAKALAEKGELKLLLSLSKDTQNQVFEVPIDANGNAVIDPESELGKMFFSQEGGKAVFNGKYAEIAQMMGRKDGAEHVRILSTVVGDGVDSISIPGSEPETTTDVIRDFTFRNTQYAPRDVDLPLIVPLIGRRPLEPVADKPKEQLKKKIEDSQPEKQKPKGSGGGEEIPKGVFRAEDQKEPEEESEDNSEEQTGGEEIPPMAKEKIELITSEEYQALREDIEFINKKIQSNEGIIAIREDDLKSTFARKGYRELEHIPEGKDIIFNKSELRAIGDGLERILSKSKVARTFEDIMEAMAKNGISQKQFGDIKADMEEVLRRDQDGRSTLTFDDKKLKTDTVKEIMKDMRSKKTRPEAYNIRELYRTFLSKAKINSQK